MKHLYFCFILAISFFRLSAQTPLDAAVQLNASVQTNPAQIVLSWPTTANTTQYTVFRKLKTDQFWGVPLGTLPGSATQYTDNAVTLGTNYEYRVLRTGSGFSGNGYLNAGIEIPETPWRGKLILVVDSQFIGSLATELTRLVADIEGDGWKVIRHDVLRTGSVTHVKELIVADYYADTLAPKALFLVGHVPVPYSGNINPDGHGDHLGAWPADGYYADVDGTWTDNAVNSTTASPARTQNVPGDGKFDQNLVPTDLELQVGRVDFYDLPAFSASETQLLKNYLDKDHDYRKKNFSVTKQAVIDDNFGYFSGEAFAASAYKNFGPLVGNSNVAAADYFTAMTSSGYQWSFGCGGGTYVSAGGVGSTTNFAASNLNGVFTMLFGSYFGDWDSQNNFLRAPLAQGKILTSVWSGRPHYQFHHMGLGENIGYSVLLTQNNPGGLYFASPTGISGRWVHNALMGDPTLRNDVVAPVSNVVANKVGRHCHISWTASPENTLVGYNIYRKTDTSDVYTKINASPIAGTSYTDFCLFHVGEYTYQVRALKLEVTPSGSYYNLSEGIADTAYNSTGLQVQAEFSYTNTGQFIVVNNTSINADTYFWDLGDGVTTSTLTNPSITYTTPGTYFISLVASNGCRTDTLTEWVVFGELGLASIPSLAELSVFPNPGNDYVQVKGYAFPVEVKVYSSSGQLLIESQLLREEDKLRVTELPKGLYLLRIGKDTSRLVKLIKE